MKLINGKPMIHRQLERIKKSATIDKIIVATSSDVSDDNLAHFLESNGVQVFRGSLEDVLSRFLVIQELEQPTAIVRLTGDCPLVMPELIDEMVQTFYKSNVDYLSNTLELSFPDGLDVELIRPSAFKKLMAYTLSPVEREHVTLGIYTRPTAFSLANFRCDTDLSHMRWTVDYIEDLEFVRWVYRNFQGSESSFTLNGIIELLVENPNIPSMNSVNRRSEKLGGSQFE